MPFTTRDNLRLDGAPPSSGGGGPPPRLAAISFAFGRSNPGAIGPLASLSMAVPGQKDPSKFVSGAKTVKESATGLEFSAEYCTRGASGCTTVAGLGVRAKRILGLKNINVYAVGLYVDPSGLRAKLAKYKGQNQDKLVADSSLYKDFVAAKGVDKTVRLIINYGNISSDTFSNALKASAPNCLHAGVKCMKHVRE